MPYVNRFSIERKFSEARCSPRVPFSTYPLSQNAGRVTGGSVPILDCLNGGGHPAQLCENCVKTPSVRSSGIAL